MFFFIVKFFEIQSFFFFDEFETDGLWNCNRRRTMLSISEIKLLFTKINK